MTQTSLALWRECLKNHLRGLVVTTIAAVAVSLALRDNRPGWLAYWTATAVLLAGLRYLVHRACGHGLADGAAPRRTRQLRRLHLLGLLGSGLCWAGLGWWGIPAYSGAQRFTILVMLSGLAGGATATLAPLRYAGKVYITLLLLPACYRLLQFDDAANLALGILGLMFVFIMISTHISNHELLTHAINLSRDNEGLISELSSNNAVLEERIQARTRTLHDMAQRDLLTGLLNRRGLQAFEHGLPGNSGVLVCAFIDLDHFKQVNDVHGHETGDELLQVIAARLTEQAPQLARALQFTCHAACRWGGDEFVLCGVGDGVAPPAMQAALRGLHDVLSAPVRVGGRHVATSVSIGIAHAPMGQAAVQEVLSRADLAVAEAKHQGRGRILTMTDELLQLHWRRQLLLGALASAHVDHSLHLVFQPLVAARSHEVVAMEALLRWHCEQAGPVSPAEFIPLAESTDHIIHIGQWVLMRACAAAATWPCAPGGQPVRVAVNTSIKQLSSERFMRHLLHVLVQTGLPPRRLVIEVTESVFEDFYVEQILANLLALKNLGVEIHIDDFGTGYSSLSRLQEFPLHAVKIDKTFVHSHDSRSRSVIQAVVLIAHSFGLRTIAEGIETAEQADALARLGVDELQGYHFGRPGADVSAWLPGPACLAPPCAPPARRRAIESAPTQC